ncbi:MAG: hypothetical protein K2Z81_14340, partial [Cyanobacteria bacterium]|nr:hypothetical protein [Cyanobacteriota bacterium]
MTESAIQSEFVRAQDQFRAGKWREAEESFVSTIEKVGEANQRGSNEHVRILLEYTELLIQKERK